MIKRDRKITIECEICGRQFKFFVNGIDWQNYMFEPETKSAKEWFPYLDEEEIEVIETGICSECY